MGDFRNASPNGARPGSARGPATRRYGDIPVTAESRQSTKGRDPEAMPPKGSARYEVIQRRRAEAAARADSRPLHRKEDPAPRSVRQAPGRGRKAHKTQKPQKTRRGFHIQRAGTRRIVARAGVGIFVILAAVAVWQREAPVKPPEGLETNEVIAEQSPPIAPSAAEEMFIPAIDVHANFEDGACRVKNGAIDPATLDKACTYTADDKPYSLPGTNSPDVVVIAGHTGAGVPAVFDNLYDGSADHHRVKVGDKLYLRTADSGDNWLVYAATDLHDPVKEGLSEDSSVWGEGATPGRLLTISCIQPANPLQASVRNAVVGWQFQGTSNTASNS
ncbi:Sortase (surface protein transpeptidase) [Corynebacterium jeikeium]|nr:Sortase (surface protein transpeptidase) [Corynebacterium jeikeium]